MHMGHYIGNLQIGVDIVAILTADIVTTGEASYHFDSVNVRTLCRGSATASFVRQTSLACGDLPRLVL